MSKELEPKFSPIGIVYPDDYDFKQWLKDGVYIGMLSKSLMFCLGDWCNFGETKYGEKYSQALDCSKFDYGTLRNAAWVCKHVPIERRNSNLFFGHHYEVAKLEPELQLEYLSKAEVNGWSVRQLRQCVKGFVNGEPNENPPALITFSAWKAMYEHENNTVLSERERKIASNAWKYARERRYEVEEAQLQGRKCDKVDEVLPSNVN